MTVFGPGVGECIVLHLGNGDWIIIDSCLLPSGSNPAAIDYLRSIGVDPARNVRKVVATHWHDDHIQGIAKILRECPNAEFVMSAALGSPMFFQLVLEINAQNRLVKHNSSASEFAEILEVLDSRGKNSYPVGPSLYAQDGSRIFRGGYRAMTEVWALSPSSATITNSLAGLADRLLTAGGCRRFKRFSPNDLSVAMLVQTGTYDLLLGADLENSRNQGFGWKAVLSSSNRPTGQAHAFKIAHHGSANGHDDNVWLSMLINQPVAIVTPFAKLVTPLPTKADIQRIKSKTKNAYCTTWPISRKPPRRRGVDGIVRGATRSRRALNTSCGYVRLRVDLIAPSSTPTIELFGSAAPL